MPSWPEFWVVKEEIWKSSSLDMADSSVLQAQKWINDCNRDRACRGTGKGHPILPYPTPPYPYPYPCPSPPIPSHPILSYPKSDFSPYLLQSSTRHTPTYSTNTSRTHISLDMPSEMPTVGTNVSALSHPSSLKGHLSLSLHLLHKATLLQLCALHHFSPTKEEPR